MLRQLVYKTDLYFLSEEPEEITKSDRMWFYGSYGIIITICLYVAAQLY